MQSDASDEDYFEAVASQSEALSNAELKALEGQVCNLLLAAEVKKVSHYCMSMVVSYSSCCNGILVSITND